MRLLLVWGLLALSLGAMAVPLPHEQREEVAQAEDGIQVLKDILTTLQSEKADETVQEAEEEEAEEKVSQTTKSQDKDSRRKAMLQHALRIGLMQMSRKANRQSQQQSHRGMMQRGRRSAAAKPMQKRSAGAKVQGHRKALENKATKNDVTAKKQWWFDIDPSITDPIFDIFYDYSSYLPYDYSSYLPYDYSWYLPYDYSSYLPYDYDNYDWYSYWPDYYDYSYYDYNPYGNYYYDYYGYPYYNKGKAMKTRAKANAIGPRRRGGCKQAGCHMNGVARSQAGKQSKF